ncbi:hypothetical protein NDU88_003016 [Pleurodeles waltl]|uniref:Uncharacterized protein n=1 Tax=Pleurodeles waltl TaxID=8319 RepID=A0AAV7LFH0_PLEWA|nr:hypothetical protein NDU88_003016 [Pleurodeles waltl]
MASEPRTASRHYGMLEMWVALVERHGGVILASLDARRRSTAPDYKLVYKGDVCAGPNWARGKDLLEVTMVDYGEKSQEEGEIRIPQARHDEMDWDVQIFSDAADSLGFGLH